MPKMSEIRERFPMYADVPDDQLLIAVRQKFYPDIEPAKFYASVERDTERAKMQQEQLDDMGWGGQFAAGMGKSVDTLARTARRAFDPSYGKAEAQEDARIDAPLNKTSGGSWGGLAGDVLLTAIPGLGAAKVLTAATKGAGRLATMGAPGVLRRTLGGAATTAAPYIGAAGAGAATGAALKPEDMGQGATEGAAFGALGEAGGRVVSSLYGGAKALVEPLYQEGRERILKRTLERFADNPEAAKRAAAQATELVPGVTPSLAEATGDAGLAQLQRSAASISPDVASALDDLNRKRVGAYRNVLDDLAGNDGRRTFYESARDVAADDLYGKAFGQPLKLTEQGAADVGELLARPSVRAAQAKAQALAAEQGIKLTEEGSLQGMHYLKKALDDEIAALSKAGRTTEANAVLKTQQKLVETMRANSPQYAEAMSTYAEMSRPLNQMAVGQELRDKLVPALADFGGSAQTLPRNKAEVFAQAIRDGDKTAQRATGLTGATLEGTLDAGQLSNVRGMARDMARYADAAERGSVAGSRTAQHLAAQNTIRQILGPLGLPDSVGDSMAGRLTAGMLSLPFTLTKSQTEELLARALTDPRTAAALMNATDPATIAQLLQPYASQALLQVGVND